DKELVKEADKQVDSVHFSSRSEFVEECIRKYLKDSETAVILGGGDPEKLKVDGKFKFLVPVFKDKCMLELLLEKLSYFGKIYIIAQKEVVDACFETFGDKFENAEIIYIEERKEMGNAKTLELAKDKLGQKFLILPIDQFYEFDFSDLIRKHEINSAIFKGTVTLAVTPGSSDKKLGSISMSGNQIIGHYEGSGEKRNIASAFAAVCDKKIFEYIPKGSVKWTLQEDVYPKIIKNGGMFGYITEHPIFNIHSRKELLELKRYLDSRK
ncbi:MAG: hypothetical protein JW727_06760, partial [Candidatus Aenigmarchaeota archaeon]|nr:hypothetical protein [Candidatus Aenigmarchaeota archaeon]